MKSRALGLVLPRGPQHAVANAEHALHALKLLRGQRLVDALGGEIVVQPLRQQRQRIDFQRQLFDHGHLVFGLGLGCASHRRDQIAEKHLVGIAAGLRGLIPDRFIALLGAGKIARGGEDDFAPSAGKTLAAAAGAGLDNDGMALLRARHRERSARLEELPLVVETLDLGRIGKAAAFLVYQERAVFPGIPVAEHHFHEFVGAVVTQIMLEMGVLAHIVRLAVID